MTGVPLVPGGQVKVVVPCQLKRSLLPALVFVGTTNLQPWSVKLPPADAPPASAPPAGSLTVLKLSVKTQFINVADPFDMHDLKDKLPHVAEALRRELPVMHGFNCSAL